MALAYSGPGSASGIYKEQPGGKWKITAEGFDTKDITWAGPKQFCENLVGKHSAARGKSMPGHPGMYLVGVASEEDRSWGWITLTYVGWRNGTPPAALPKDRISTKTATFATDAPQNVSVYDSELGAYKLTNQKAHRDLSYNSPETTWNYTSNTYRTSPVGYGVQGAGSGVRQPFIFRSVITLDDGTRFSGLAPVGLVSALSRSPYQILNDFSCDKVPYTPYYACQEVWAYEYLSDT